MKHPTLTLETHVPTGNMRATYTWTDDGMRVRVVIPEGERAAFYPAGSEVADALKTAFWTTLVATTADLPGAREVMEAAVAAVTAPSTPKPGGN